MVNSRNLKHNITAVILLIAVFIAAFSSGAYAASLPEASAQINSSDGAILRKSSTTTSAKLTVLSDNTKITIHKEVYKTKTSTAKKNKWYYVTANGKKGYVRSDLVDTLKYGTVSAKTTAKIKYYKGAGTKMKKAVTFKKGAKLTVVLKATPVSSTKGGSSTWYKVKSGSKYYYVCSKYVKITGTASSPAQTTSTTANTTTSTSASTGTSATTLTSASAASTSDSGYVDSPETGMTDAEFEKYLSSEGFPEAYKVKLRILHKAHPNWGFVAYKTNISWSTALSKQTSGGTSLVSSAFPKTYRDGTKQYEKGWYKASSKVVAYYMDPRNFLTENSIYMFEDLSYKPKYQTTSVVSAILSPTKLPGYGFTADVFVKAGEACKVSPVFLASRARQETGSGSDAINGTKVLGKKVYNPFNIGAFGGTNPLYNGLLYAYAKGWTTPAKAVQGGAQELAKNYINQGQYTGYYQRFNVHNGEKKVGTHQYMTNIMAPYSEALSTKTSYAKYGITDKELVFEIPIYDGMPASTKLP